MNFITDGPALLGIAGAWLAYGLIHSWLAGTAVKHWVHQRWPQGFPGYRLAFNLLAVALLLPPIWLTLRAPGPALWAWPGWIAWPAAMVAGLGFLWSLRWYDGMDFLGLRQWRHGEGKAREALCISPLHRHVRHPWYSLGLLLLWTRDLNAAWLISALAITGYVLVGYRLEERKLLAQYGEPYARYLSRVPALLPWPGRALNRHEAAALEAWSGRIGAGEEQAKK